MEIFQALNLDRREQDRLTADIDSFTNLYRSVLSAGVDVNMTNNKTGRQWVYESGKRIDLTDAEIEATLQEGITKSRDLTAATKSD